MQHAACVCLFFHEEMKCLTLPPQHVKCGVNWCIEFKCWQSIAMPEDRVSLCWDGSSGSREHWGFSRKLLYIIPRSDQQQNKWATRERTACPQACNSGCCSHTGARGKEARESNWFKSVSCDLFFGQSIARSSSAFILFKKKFCVYTLDMKPNRSLLTINWSLVKL